MRIQHFADFQKPSLARLLSLVPGGKDGRRKGRLFFVNVLGGISLTVLAVWMLLTQQDQGRQTVA
jgi:hypothetical protein